MIMHYPVNTLDNKKMLLKLRLLRILDNLFGSSMFWFLIGYLVSTVTMFLLITDVFQQLDKIMVCK